MQTNEPAKLFVLRALAPTRLNHHYYVPACLRALRACAPLLSPINALHAFFILCCVVSVVRYGLRLNNPRKATGPDFMKGVFTMAFLPMLKQNYQISYLKSCFIKTYKKLEKTQRQSHGS